MWLSRPPFIRFICRGADTVIHLLSFLSQRHFAVDLAACKLLKHTVVLFLVKVSRVHTGYYCVVSLHNFQYSMVNSHGTDRFRLEMNGAAGFEVSR